MSPNKSLLTLPTLDGKYKRNYECVWYACSVKEEPYHLELTEFDLEYSTTTAGKCLKDWLEIRKGGQNGLLEGKLCGRLAGERQYTINDQCLWLRFRSDGGHQRKGFNGWFALRSELIDISSKNSGLSEIKKQMLKILAVVAPQDMSFLDTFDNIIYLTVNDSDAMEGIKTLLTLSKKSHKAAVAILEAFDLCSLNPISCTFPKDTKTTECGSPTPTTSLLKDGEIGSSDETKVSPNELLKFIHGKDV
jgi:hypothetical protein